MPRWLRTGWESVISQGKSLEILRHGCMGIQPGPWRGHTVGYINSPTELS